MATPHHRQSTAVSVTVSYDVVADQILDFVERADRDLSRVYVSMMLAQAHDRGLRIARNENTDRIVEAVIAEWRAAMDRQEP